VAFFNNKGGVGKTTLACNFAASQASDGRRVLIVDLDPQCNSTQLVLSDDQWSAIYEDTAESDSKTVMALLRRIRAAIPTSMSKRSTSSGANASRPTFSPDIPRSPSSRTS
jgi:cellulose biosynthesis protein BcsQ